MVASVALPWWNSQRFQVIPWHQEGSRPLAAPASPVWPILLIGSSATLVGGHQAQAGAITHTVIRAMSPIVDLVQALGHPIAYVMISVGALSLMLGNRKQGMALIKLAAIGYLTLAFVPVIMTMLDSVSNAMKAAS